MVNLAYYAMFYGVLAVLATRKLSASKHSGALGLFDREFINQDYSPVACPAPFASLSTDARLTIMAKS